VSFCNQNIPTSEVTRASNLNWFADITNTSRDRLHTIEHTGIIDQSLLRVFVLCYSDSALVLSACFMWGGGGGGGTWGGGFINN